MKPLNDVNTHYAIEQFYYKEARLLDERKFQSWMDILAPGIEYTMPNRANTGIDSSLQNTEAMLDVAHELSQGVEAPLRQDDFMTLTFRANRPTSALAIADNPLTRTVRLVSNVEPYKIDSVNKYKRFKVYNNVSMSFSRHGHDNHIFYFSRHDELEKIDGEFKLAKREIILDWNVITAPTVGMLL